MSEARTELQRQIAVAKCAVKAAEDALLAFDERPENNVFPTMAEAEAAIEDALAGLAHDDCQGAYNCGEPTYSRRFIVDGKTYKGTLACEYNRHDKTYYYVDETEFTVEEVTA